MRRITKIVVVAALIVLPMALSACNTTQGAGKDMQKAGEKVQDAAS